MMSSSEELREQLREWREEGGRHSDLVVQAWEAEGLDSLVADFQDEQWMVVEQVCVAALDTNRGDIVNECLGKLVDKFGASSLRVRRLIAMKLEMEERWDQALDTLDTIIEEDEANSSARKRKIAIYKAQGDTGRVVQELTKYLKVFMSDQEAWMELCDLYIQEQEYNKAAFCCEEVLLHNPHNQLYHLRMAEIRYTMGGLEQLELAKNYYSQCIKLAPSNMRALYGLLLTTTQLAASPKAPQAKRKETMALAVWASKQVGARYSQVQGGGVRGVGGQQMAVLKSLMGDLDIRE